MPRAVTADGTELHWEERGSGPPILLVSYWSFEPRVWDPLSAELEADFRLIRYDDRGTGRSERRGPYDIETAAADLETIVEVACDGPALAVCMVDGTNRAVRVAARRPDLITHVLAAGGPPLPRDAFASSDSLISSNTVVQAFLQQLEMDYRGAVRALMEAGNAQMTQEELRDRVAKQVEHVPLEVASARIRAWAEDEGAVQPARDLADRLVMMLGVNAGGGWFPDEPEMNRIVAQYFPEATIEHVDDGIISRPDQAAAIARGLRSAIEAADVESRA
jgi:pimeloyl-ACP methyl ester carboxylesterase